MTYLEKEMASSRQTIRFLGYDDFSHLYSFSSEVDGQEIQHQPIAQQIYVERFKKLLIKGLFGQDNRKVY